MGSLPKSFTPFSLISTGGGGGLESETLSSDSIWLRKCESLTATPSLPYFNGNEPNNNTLSHPPSQNQNYSQQSQSKEILKVRTQKKETSF